MCLSLEGVQDKDEDDVVELFLGTKERQTSLEEEDEMERAVEVKKGDHDDEDGREEDHDGRQNEEEKEDYDDDDEEETVEDDATKEGFVSIIKDPLADRWWWWPDPSHETCRSGNYERIAGRRSQRRPRDTGVEKIKILRLEQ